jgi:hypothetical protein
MCLVGEYDLQHASIMGVKARGAPNVHMPRRAKKKKKKKKKHVMKHLVIR